MRAALSQGTRLGISRKVLPPRNLRRAWASGADWPRVPAGLTGYDQSATKTQLMDHFRSFSPSVQRMLDLVPEDGVKLWDLMDMELQTSLIKGKAILIGDAAHPFLPRKDLPQLLSSPN